MTFNFSTLSVSDTYAIVLSTGGAFVGKPTETSVAGLLERRTSIIPDTTETGSNLQCLTIVVQLHESGYRDHVIYEIDIPIGAIIAVFHLGSFKEPVIQTPADPLWQRLSLDRMWPNSLTQIFGENSVSLASAKGYVYRCTREPHHSESFPHPLSFPRFAPFVPDFPLVVYFDPTLAERHLGLRIRSNLMTVLRSLRIDELPREIQLKDGQTACIEAWMAFFDPPQIVTLEGRSGELVALTPKPSPASPLGDDWLLGFVRNECFPFFRECVERLDESYRIFGVWQRTGAFETEYGVRSEVLVICAAAHLGRRPENSQSDAVSAIIDVSQVASKEVGELLAAAPSFPTVVFDDESELVHLDGQPYFISREFALVIRALWRLQKKSRGPVSTEKLRAEAKLPTTINHILREENPALTKLIKYDLTVQGWKLENVRLPRVFLSYVRENIEDVRRIYCMLEDFGFDIWWDGNISAGQDWKLQIKSNIERADYFILCLSSELAGRIRSGVFPELHDAIAIQRLSKPDSIFILIAELSPCDLPIVRIDDLRTLRDLQAVRLYPETEWFNGVSQLMRSMSTDMLQRHSSSFKH
jgi:hypothetical protein